MHPKDFVLANRGVTVADLFPFYEELGTESVMPHFDPDESTAHDVESRSSEV